MRNDRYNARSLVNLGNVLAEAGQLDRAKETYLEAIGEGHSAALNSCIMGPLDAGDDCRGCHNCGRVGET